MRKLTNEEYIQKAREIHGNKFDYSKTTYISSREPIVVICPIHGEFQQLPKSHLIGSGCPQCGNKLKSQQKKLTQEIFVTRCNEVHNNKYDYSKVIYTNKRDKVTIICPIHGEFEQEAGHHMRGQGCPECGKEYASTWRKNDYKHFIDESKKRFGDIYEFPNIETEYENSHSKVTIKCKKCGNVFIKGAGDHITSNSGGCLKCNVGISKNEIEIGDFVKTLIGDIPVYLNDRTLLKGKEIDLLIPTLKIGIEYNGLYWHNSERKGEDSHLYKLELCKKEGYKLIQIFEDEYIKKQDIVENKIKHILGLKNDVAKIYGRKIIIKNITNIIAKQFLEIYHIQGFVSSSIYYGAYYQDKLIAVMTFKRERNDNNNWELTRFASDYNYICCGVGGKLFKHFIREYNPDSVKSFADRRWTVDEENNIYIQLGFKFDGYTSPDYRYMISSKFERFHKFGFRKNILLKKYPDKLTSDMTEREMCQKIKAYRVYDCGVIRYIWRKEN